MGQREFPQSPFQERYQRMMLDEYPYLYDQNDMTASYVLNFLGNLGNHSVNFTNLGWLQKMDSQRNQASGILSKRIYPIKVWIMLKSIFLSISRPKNVQNIFISDKIKSIWMNTVALFYLHVLAMYLTIFHSLPFWWFV